MSQSKPFHLPKPTARRGRLAVATAVVVAITVASGILHGRQTHRWGPPGDLARAAKDLQTFPRTVGAWETTAEEDLDEVTLQVLDNPGYLVRSYENKLTGETVKLAILVGIPGPIAVHSPEICYASTAYNLADESEAVTLNAKEDDQASTFWKLALEPRRLSDPPLVVYYAWSTGDRWEAAQNPRFTYGNKRYLYKLQLAAVQPPPGGREEDPGQRFLLDLLASGSHAPLPGSTNAAVKLHPRNGDRRP